MREVVVQGAGGALAQQVTIGSHTIRGDEPVNNGGTDSGPAPHELLLSALGACTAMTIRAYAARKGWPLRDVHVRLTGGTIDGRFAIRKQVTLDGDLDASQRARLIEIADRCPVHRTLSGPIDILTSETQS
jgi:putative redox protein